MSARVVVSVGVRSVCEVSSVEVPVLSVVSGSGSVLLSLVPPVVVTDGDVEAVWGLLDALRVFVVAVEAVRDRQVAEGLSAPAGPGSAVAPAGVPALVGVRS